MSFRPSACPGLSLARELWHAGTFVLIAGACICILTVLTGFRDLLKFPDPGPAAVRSVAIHVCVMVSVYMIGVADIAWRLRDYPTSASTPPGILILSLAAAAGVGVGAAYGGALVFRHVLASRRLAPAPPRPLLLT